MFFFFFNDTATTEIYTLSLHDALPISRGPSDCPRTSARRESRRARPGHGGSRPAPGCARPRTPAPAPGRRGRSCADRKSTRLNSSHLVISYAVFCLKKKIDKSKTHLGH